MSLAWRLARRDLAAGGRQLWLLALCLLLGTAALAGIGSLSASILAALDAQGRSALGGDLELRVSQRRASVEEAAAFAALGPVAETVTMRAMAQSGSAAPMLVELRGVDVHWPLVGRFALAPGALRPRPRGAEVAVAPALAERLGLKPGDMVRIGAARLRVIGLIAAEPDQLGEGFRLGPPAIVDMAGLDATQLVQPGSLYASGYRLRLPPGADARATGERLVRRFPGAGWSYRTTDQATRGLSRSIGQLGQFLLLVGLAALTVAGVGVGSGVSAYLDGKTRAIAVLKVLGARARTIAAMFLIELGLITGAAILAGCAIGAAVPVIVAHAAGDALPVRPEVAIYPAPLAIAAALSLLVALLFALPALARAGAVPAASLLRDALAEPARPGVRVLLGMIALAAALAALAILSASDRLIAAGFVGATAALIALLAGIGWLVRIGVARLPRPRRPLPRLALANLHRPGAQTGRLVVALGLGFSLFVALAVIDTSLSRQIEAAAPAKAPRFFAIDLQPEDQPAFLAAIRRAAPGARIETAPSLRGSVTGLGGVAVAAMRPPPASWVLRGDRTLTWSATLPPHNRIVAGRWWPPGYRGPPLVSIGDDMAKSLNLKVGDQITVSVLGVDVPARIAAIRTIDWTALGLNFAIIFSPGYIEEAPHSVLASVYAQPGADGGIARAVAAALPSVTMIRVGDVIGQVSDLLARVALAIRAAAGVTVAAGIVVLAGAVSASGRTRRYDAVILKLLGGTRAQVLGAQAIEYALLAALLALIALGIGAGAGWYVVAQVLTLPFAPDWGVVALTLLAACLVTLGIGLAGSLPALAARPAESLRGL